MTTTPHGAPCGKTSDEICPHKYPLSLQALDVWQTFLA
jgi:hypothetical protein